VLWPHILAIDRRDQQRFQGRRPGRAASPAVSSALRQRSSSGTEIKELEMKKFLRLMSAAMLTLIGIRFLDWLLTPLLPLITGLLVTGAVLYVAIGNRRQL
jgi:hypothetical protein